jgi:hypothetical protein
MLPSTRGTLRPGTIRSCPCLASCLGTHIKPIRIALTALGLLLNLGAAPVAIAHNWPMMPVKPIAVFPAGGSVDQVARVLAQQLTEQTGQPVFVENRGGASGSIVIPPTSFCVSV